MPGTGFGGGRAHGRAATRPGRRPGSLCTAGAGRTRRGRDRPSAARIRGWTRRPCTRASSGRQRPPARPHSSNGDATTARMSDLTGCRVAAEDGGAGREGHLCARGTYRRCSTWAPSAGHPPLR